MYFTRRKNCCTRYAKGLIQYNTTVGFCGTNSSDTQPEQAMSNWPVKSAPVFCEHKLRSAISLIDQLLGQLRLVRPERGDGEPHDGNWHVYQCRRL